MRWPYLQPNGYCVETEVPVALLEVPVLNFRLFGRITSEFFNRSIGYRANKRQGDRCKGPDLLHFFHNGVYSITTFNEFPIGTSPNLQNPLNNKTLVLFNIEARAVSIPKKILRKMKIPGFGLNRHGEVRFIYSLVNHCITVK